MQLQDNRCGSRLLSRTTGRSPIAANNLVAVGCMSTLRRHDRHVPDDGALACYGDLELTARCSIAPHLHSAEVQWRLPRGCRYFEGAMSRIG